MEPATAREINLYDVADWLWAYRLLAALLALAGLAGAAAVWLMSPPSPPVYRTEFLVYSSGTPVRSSTEITDILIGQLSDSLPNMVFGAASNPLVVDFSSGPNAEIARRSVADLEASLLAEVRELQADTAPLVGTSEAALTLNLDAKAFVDGSETGLIKMIQVAAREVPAARPVRTSVMLLAVAGFLFFLLAGTHSFWQRWRATRSVSR